MASVLVTLLLAICVVGSAGLNILGVFFIPSISHQLFYRSYLLELNRRGHNLTVITTDPVDDPSLKNYTEIAIRDYYPKWREEYDKATEALGLLRLAPELFCLSFCLSAHEMCHLYMSDPRIQQLIANGPVFDLVVVEYGGQPCIYAFASLAKNGNYIGIFSFSLGTFINTVLTNTASGAYLPDPFLPYLSNMTFSQRLRSVTFQAISWVFYWYSHVDQTSIVRQYFGQDVPTTREFEKNVSLVLTNDHFTVTFPRPAMPNYVGIGGPPFHLYGKNPKALPKDLQFFLDDAPNGVIYFSLGSNVKSSTISASKRTIIVDALRQMKQKVIWKWETDDLPGKPDNVKVQKWLPQVDILAHPNIKAFISQGGLQSIGEATHFNVPMVIIPFFTDQELNANKLESVGAAVQLDFESMTTADILKAVNEVVNDPRYKENMVKYSALTKDQPQTPMERAMWWTDYVIRHNGAKHLKSPALNMPWYEYFMVDVLAFLMVALVSILYIVVLVTRSLLRLCFRLRKRKQKKD